MESSGTTGITSILSKLDLVSLSALASTVTNGLLKNKLTTKRGAIEAILVHSPDLESILRRKIITREILFAYLHENNVSVTCPTTKNELVYQICNLWNLKQCTTASTVVTPQIDLHDPNQLALQFSEWFYALMNRNEPIPSEHFWPDVNLTINLIFPTQTLTENVESNPCEAAKMLFTKRLESGVYLNPNLSSAGTRGRMDVHGLVEVLSCGSLHTNNTCVGVFEQMFMLARDPFVENNWKIKRTQLNLRSKSDVRYLPSLTDRY